MKQYCVQCEEMVNVSWSGFHMFPKWMDLDLPEEMFCTGFFTSCPPPDLGQYWDDNWQDLLIEPTEDEWTKINLNADELLMDFVAMS